MKGGFLEPGHAEVSMRQVLPRIRKAEDSAVAGISDFAGPQPELRPKPIIRWPGCGIHSPGKRIVAEDQTCAANMSRRRYHQGRGPVVCLHQLVGVKGALNCVPRPVFRKQSRSGYTLGASKLHHHLGLHETVRDRSSREQQARCNPCLILANALEQPGLCFRPDRSVVLRRIAQNQNHIELSLLGVLYGNGEINN